jgi:hypothetical protein
MSMWQSLFGRFCQTGNRVQTGRRRQVLTLEAVEERLCPAPYMLVTDAGDDAAGNHANALYRYDGITGAPVDNFVPTRPDMVTPDLGLVLSPDQQYVLVDGYGTHNVVRFNILDGSPAPADGQTGANFVEPGSGGLAATEGLDFGPDGNLYVANAIGLPNNGNVLEYDGSTGAFVGVFVAAGVGGMGRANDLHWGPDGNLYVSLTGGTNGNGKVLRYDATGTPFGVDGSTTDATFIDVGAGLFCNGFGFGPDGNLYVAVDTNTYIMGRVLRFNPDGSPNPADGQTGATFVPVGSGGVRFIDGIGFGFDGNLYVTDIPNTSPFMGGQVLEYDINDNSGAFVGTFVDAGSGGMAIAATVLFYDDGTAPSVAPHNNHQLSRLRAGGADSLAAQHSGQTSPAPIETGLTTEAPTEQPPSVDGVLAGSALPGQDGVKLAHHPAVAGALADAALAADLDLPAL